MLEGLTNATYWDWKDSLGPLRERPGFQGVWGYQQTHGLGMMEYLEWAEDMGLQAGKSTPSSVDALYLLMNLSPWCLGRSRFERRCHTSSRPPAIY